MKVTLKRRKEKPRITAEELEEGRIAVITKDNRNGGCSEDRIVHKVSCEPLSKCYLAQIGGYMAICENLDLIEVEPLKKGDRLIIN